MPSKETAIPQYRQGSQKDAQNAVAGRAIIADSPYGPVQGLAALDYQMGQALFPNSFDDAMKYAGLGLSPTDIQNREAVIRAVLARKGIR